MFQQGGERMLSEEEVGLALAAHGLPAARLSATALVIAREMPLRVVWANGEAAQLFGTRDARALSDQLFAGAGRDGLVAAVGRLRPDAGPRGERLRLYRGFRTRTLSVALSRARLPGGDEVVVITVPTGGVHADGRASGLLGLVPLDGSEAVARPEATDVASRRDVLAQPAASARPATPAPSAGDVVEQLARLGRRRFLWQTGADGRLLGPVGAEGLRPIRAETILADLLRKMDAGDGVAAASALQAARPFHALTVSWPLAETRGHVPVRLGGMPVRRGGEFAGFRGFGIAHFDRAALSPDPAPLDEAPFEEAPFSAALFEAAQPGGPETEPLPVAPAQDAAPEPPVAETPASQAEEPLDDTPATLAEVGATPEGGASVSGPAGLEPDRLADLVPGQDDAPGASPIEPSSDAVPSRRGGKVVALRRFLSIGSHGGLGEAANSDAAPAPRRSGDPLRADTNLSFTEQFNFNEIARALKGPPPSRADDPAPPPAGTGDQAAVLAALPLAVLVMCGGRLVYANPAFSDLTGFAGVQALEQAGGLSHLLGGLDPAQVAAGSQDRAFPVVGVDGQVLSVEGRLVPLHWSGQPATGLTMRRVGDRSAEIQNLKFDARRRERDAAEARALLDQAAVATVVLDVQGRVLGLSGAGEALFGVHQNGVVGEPVGTLLTAESQSAALGAVAAAAGSHGAPAAPDLLSPSASVPGGSAPSGLIAVTGRRGTGETMPLSMSVRALEPGRVGVVFREGGETEVLRHEVARLTSDLAGSAAERFDFLAKVSHEIRTPLNAILGFAEVMLDERFGPVGNPRYKDYLTDIRAAGTHVMDLVEDLLDLSKMKAGRGDMKVAATDVNRVIGDVVSDMQGLAHRDRVIVRTSLPPHLPQALVDEAAIRQVMGIILSNAIRYNEPGGQVIVSSAATEGQGIVVRVRDTGVGMSEAEVARALEPFREIATDQPGHGGLGLPMARALVEANQATLSVRSRKHEGTLVEIVLRAASEAASAPAA